MNNLITIGVIFLASLGLGLIKFGIYDSKSWNWQHKFAEIWNGFVNFFLPGLIGYYFVIVRWPLLLKGGVLTAGDFFLFIVFMMGLFGHLCVISKNITEGIEVILKRILEGK